MTLTAWDVYWVTRLDGIRLFLFLTAVALLLWLLLHLFNSDFYNRPSNKRLVATLAAGVFVAAALIVFTPSMKQAAAMIVLPTIVNSEAVQQLPGELTTLAKEWLIELRPNKETHK